MKIEYIKRRTVILLVLGLASIFVLGTSILHVSAKKQFTNESIEGTYGFSASGNLINFGPAKLTGPFNSVGLDTFDGHGGCTVTSFAANLPPPVGPVPETTSTACTYKVNPNGTGTKTFTFPNSVNHISFVIVNNGKEILEIQTDTGAIISGIAKRQEKGGS